MVKVLDTYWISGATNVGLVKIQNEMGEIKYYAGAIEGLSEEADTDYLVKYSTPVHSQHVIEFLINKASLDKALAKLSDLILRTPTGKVREKLTDINILLHDCLKRKA